MLQSYKSFAFICSIEENFRSDHLCTLQKEIIRIMTNCIYSYNTFIPSQIAFKEYFYQKFLFFVDTIPVGVYYKAYMGIQHIKKGVCSYDI